MRDEKRIDGEDSHLELAVRRVMMSVSCIHKEQFKQVVSDIDRNYVGSYGICCAEVIDLAFQNLMSTATVVRGKTWNPFSSPPPSCLKRVFESA